MKIRRMILSLVAIIAMAAGAYAKPLPVQAAEPTSFKNVTLWVNPEYDDPRLLVMLEGKIVGATAPARVRFLVPTGAQMYSAGSKDAQGKYSGGPPDRKPSSISGWDEISYEVKTDTFRVEYYADAITGQPDKKVSYDFRSLYPISDLTVVVQQPTKATNFTVTPNGTPATDYEGFRVLKYDYVNPDLAAPLHFDISYTKSDPSPSLGNASPSSTAGGAGSSTGLIIAIILGLGVAGFLGIWLLKSMKKSAPPRNVRRAAARRTASAGSRPRFCGQCGQQVSPADLFCGKCGKRL